MKVSQSSLLECVFGRYIETIYHRVYLVIFIWNVSTEAKYVAVL